METPESPPDKTAEKAGRTDFSRLVKTELAAALGLDLKTITKWQNIGLPFIPGSKGRGNANLYNLPDVIRWWIRKETKGGLDADAEKAKLLAEQAEAAKRKNDLASGEIIELAAVKIIAERFIEGVRQKILLSKLSRDEKQAILTDLRGLKNVDYTQIEVETDGEEPAGE